MGVDIDLIDLVALMSISLTLPENWSCIYEYAAPLRERFSEIDIQGRLISEKRAVVANVAVKEGVEWLMDW